MNDLIEALKVTSEEAELIQIITIDQQNNPLWMDVRQWRITVRNFGRVCNRNFRVLYPPSLMKILLGDYGFPTINWGGFFLCTLLASRKHFHPDTLHGHWLNIQFSFKEHSIIAVTYSPHKLCFISSNWQVTFSNSIDPQSIASVEWMGLLLLLQPFIALTYSPLTPR